MTSNIAIIPDEGSISASVCSNFWSAFLNKQRGLGNEVPFFICPIKPEESVEMERLQRQLLNHEQVGVRVLEINLYDLSMEILKERDIWDQIVEIENTITKRTAQRVAARRTGS